MIVRSPTICWALARAALLSSAALVGCAADPQANPLDPYEATNRRIYAFNEKVDDNLVRPVSVGYKNNVQIGRAHV